MTSLPAAPPALSDLAVVFGWDGPVTSLTPVAGGWTHRLSRAETPSATYATKQFLRDDKPTVQRLQRAAMYEMEMWNEGRIRMPRPHVAVDGRIIVDDFPLLDGNVGWVRVHDWVEGMPLHGGVACGLGTAYEVGGLLARLHQRAAQDGINKTPDVATDWTVEWADIATHLNSKGGAVSEYGARLHALGVFVEEMRGASDGICGKLVMSHGDVNQTNCLCADRGEIVLVDWDNAGPVDSLRELGYALLEWAGAGRGQPAFDVIREVVRGYATNGGEIDRSPASLLPAWVAAAGRWTVRNAAIVARPDGVAPDRVEGARFQLGECLESSNVHEDPGLHG